MAQYDAVIVFIIATIFVSFYIFIEARPHGSSFIADASKAQPRKHESYGSA